MTREEALQAVLAGEHAAVYAYGVVGGVLHSQSDQPAARADYDLHRARRDRVTALLVESGATPVPTAAGYDLGGPVRTPRQARALAARVEAALIGPYADLVGQSEEDLRTTAASWCALSATRSIGWGGAPTAFPGLAERA